MTDKKVIIRIIGHGTPKQWHTVSEDFALRIEAYVNDPKRQKSQYYDVEIERYIGPYDPNS